MTTPSSVTAAPDATDSAEAVAAAVAGVDGVHALGRSIERASSAVRETIGLTGLVPGVKVELDREGPVRVAVSIVVDYPNKLQEVSEAVREAARRTITAAGRDRVDVQVRVTDVWGPFDTEPAEEIEQRPDRPAGTAPVSTGAVDDPVQVSSEGAQAAPHQGDTGAATMSHASTPEADTDAVIADALADVADSVAHAAEDVRSRRIG